RYEDLATDPLSGFARLYEFCGLRWSDRVEEVIRAATRRRGSTSDDRGHRWSFRFGLSKTAFRPMDSTTALESYRQRLTEHQIAQVRLATADVASHYYPPAWLPPQPR